MCVRVGTAAPVPSGFRDAPGDRPERERTFPASTYLSPTLLGVELSRMGERYVRVTKVRSRWAGSARRDASPPRRGRRERPRTDRDDIRGCFSRLRRTHESGRTAAGRPCRGRGCRGGGCCTFARAPRLQKPRNHAEEWFQRRPGSGSHVRRPPSVHTGARQPRTTIDGKACNSAENMSSLRTGPALPCATPEKAASRPRCCTDTPQSRAGVRPISATWGARAAAACGTGGEGSPGGAWFRRGGARSLAARIVLKEQP